MLRSTVSRHLRAALGGTPARLPVEARSTLSVWPHPQTYACSLLHLRPLIAPARSSSTKAKPGADTPNALDKSQTSASHNVDVAQPRTPEDVVVRTQKHGDVIIPGRAVAGLSEEFRAELAERAKMGRELPVIYENPGSHSQLDRVPPAVVMALPPPRRPLWPVEESKRTWQLLRAFSFGLVFVMLAGYLHLKATVRGNARLSLERRAPGLAAALVKMGIIQDLAELDADLDRELLFSRVFERYSPQPGQVSKPGQARGIPAARAVKLLAALLGEPADAASKPDSAVMKAVAAAGVPTTGTLSGQQFVQLLLAGTAGISNGVVHLACEELFGVTPAPREVLNALGECYDKVVAARGAGASFTPLALSELVHEIGFSSDEASAASFLVDCSAAVTGQVSVPQAVLELVASTDGKPAAPAATGPPVNPYASFAVPMTRGEFVDFLSTAAAEANVAHDRVPEYLRVFYMLHLSGIREAAGVKPVA